MIAYFPVLSRETILPLSQLVDNQWGLTGGLYDFVQSCTVVLLN